MATVRKANFNRTFMELKCLFIPQTLLFWRF